MRTFRMAMIAGALLTAGAGAVTYGHSYASASLSTKKTVKEKPTADGASFMFSPSKLKVKAGTKVTWKNASTAPHTITSDTKSWKFDKKVTGTETYSFTFKKAGVYKYHCQYHTGMVGKITVTP
jgi:plastocyanin